MKNLAKILLVGFVTFMGLAIADEWEFFSSAWFGPDQAGTPIPEEERKAAADTVHLMLSLMSHLYGSHGDPRFADRIPAGDRVVEEMLIDIAYLERNHRRQEMILDRLEIGSVDPLREDSLEISTREHWQIRTLWITGAGEADPPRAERVRGKYLLVRKGSGWIVEGWEVLDPIPARMATGR